MTNDDVIKQHLLSLLRGGNAHMKLRDAVADFPMDRINEIFPHGTYSAWALLEHIRRTQWDILDFSRNPDYKYIEWPRDYWPAPGTQATPDDWQNTLTQIESDTEALAALVEDPAAVLYTPFPWGTGQTLMREIMLTADHNSYHLGEFAIMRQTMQTWGPNHK